MALPQDFKAFIALLNDNDVRYLIVGGYAVAFHGYLLLHVNETKVAIEIDEMTAHVIDSENLKQNKKATGRPQNIADLSNLAKKKLGMMSHDGVQL